VKKFLLVFLTIFLAFFFRGAFAGFIIYSALPNTTDDKNLEYVEVLNFSAETGSLDSYTLSDEKKDFIISDIQL